MKGIEQSVEEKTELKELQAYLLPYLEDDLVCSMNDHIQHGTTTTLQHCLSVMYASCAFASRLHLRVNYRDLAVGALLHDFYLYDWHHHQEKKGSLHGFPHPYTACRNAKRHFQINRKVQHIIRCHMWPLTFRHVPHSREAVIVCMVDKYCSTLETLAGFWYQFQIRCIRRKI